MLLEFKTKNYKSFIEEAKLTMMAAPKQSGLDYSLLHEKVKGKAVNYRSILSEELVVNGDILFRREGDMVSIKGKFPDIAQKKIPDLELIANSSLNREE